MYTVSYTHLDVYKRQPIHCTIQLKSSLVTPKNGFVKLWIGFLSYCVPFAEFCTPIRILHLGLGVKWAYICLLYTSRCV